jgi:hypothetical protein
VVLVLSLRRSDAGVSATVLAVAGTILALASTASAVALSRRRRARVRDRRVYISYAGGDRGIARALEEALEKEGFRATLGDSAELRSALADELRRSGAVLMIVPEALSRHDAHEWELHEKAVLRGARGLRRDVSAVVPVLSSPDRELPEELESTQTLRLDDPSWRTTLSGYLHRAFDEQVVQI